MVVMEPLKGGRLATKPPAAVQALWDAAPVERAPVAWALRFVWDESRVSTLLSGMSTMEQVTQNVALASEGSPASLSPEEMEVISKVREEYRTRTVVDCTACRYCLPCSEGIDIPLMLGFLNNASLYGSVQEERMVHDLVVKMGQTSAASACSECGQCVESCPQQLDIPRELAGVAKTFE